MEDPQAAPLFRFAIFMCGLLPWAADAKVGIDVTPLLLHQVSIPAILGELKEKIRTVGLVEPPGKTDAMSHGIPLGLAKVTAVMGKDEALKLS